MCEGGGGGERGGEGESMWLCCGHAFWLQETERDQLIQAKDRELAEIQQHLRQLRQKVIQIRADSDHWYIDYVIV